jgi:thiol-disulfide isomerase/thioredoxin
MKKLFTSFIFFCCIQFIASAQNKLIFGTLQGFEANSIVYLKRFTGSAISVIDSAKTDKAGKFSFINYKYPKFGLHQLAVGQYTATFPVPKNDTKIEIEATVPLLSNGKIILKNSNEVEAYNTFNQLYTNIKTQKDSIASAFKELNKFDKKYRANADKFNLFIAEKAKQTNLLLEQFAQKYPNTYAAEILVSLVKIPAKEFSIATDTMYDTPAAYLHHHFFDLVNFSNEGTIYNSIVEEKIIEYLKQHTAPSSNGIKEGMDIIVRKASANIAVKEFVVSYLLDLAAQRSDMEIAEYLFTNYYTDGCESSLKPEVSGMLENLKRLLPGNTAPDIELVDINSKRVKLSDVKNKKVILLYFWASGCGFCKEATPRLKELYAEYQNKGLEIFAVSLDKNYADWNAYIEENKLEWINASELKGWQSRAAEAYSVTGTPTYFLLDGNHKIISRQSTFDGCKKLVEELF